MVKINFRKICMLLGTLTFGTYLMAASPSMARTIIDDPGIERNDFYEVLEATCISNCDFQNARMKYFFMVNTIEVRVTTDVFYSDRYEVGKKHQCYYQGNLSSSTVVDYCVLTESPIGRTSPSDGTCSDGVKNGDETDVDAGGRCEAEEQNSGDPSGTTQNSGEIGVNLNASIGASDIDGTKCPSDAITNKDGELSYSKGILAGVSCVRATKTLEDVLLIVKNVVTKLLLPGVGTLFTIMLMFGGLVYISSSGNQQRIERGKKILTAAVIGLIIVTLAYTIIAIFANAIGGGIS